MSTAIDAALGACEYGERLPHAGPVLRAAYVAAAGSLRLVKAAEVADARPKQTAVGADAPTAA
jgi:hypothetical protein